MAAKQLSDDLHPLGMSITGLEKSVAHYMSQSYTFAVDKELLTKLEVYTSAKGAWESFRDSFRAKKDAETIPAGSLAKLLGQGPPVVAEPPGASLSGGPSVSQ